MAKVFIIDSQGNREPFSWRKVYQSALRVGAEKTLAKKIATKISHEVYNNIHTSEIFKKVEKYLYEENPEAGMRYSLKEAMRRLGPAGFLFEKYIASILNKLGFTIQLNQYISGKCVTHEIDILSKKDNQIILNECKFHTLSGGRVDLEVAMYTYARYLDIINGDFLQQKGCRNCSLRSMIITNAKFTSEAIKYANCMKIDLLGWRYPENRGLEYVIDSNKFYPITILPSLTNDLLPILADNKIILIQDLLEVDLSYLAKKLKINEARLAKLKEEAEILLKG
ncbi:MAG: hypothetical protein ACPLW7_05005 [Minisyncoccia bacterium]